MADRDNQIRTILEAWFLAWETGEAPDLDTLCGGDTELVATVEEMLADDPLDSGLHLTLGEDEGAAPIEEPVPERIGDFAIEGMIGRGGMGRVFVAWQEGLDRPVALKVVAQESVPDPRARLRLHREAQIAAGLEHPNIVPIYAVGDAGDVTWIAMKWLSGPGLDVLVGELAPRRTAEIGVAVARALEEAHQSGVLHRDVKPANVILDGDVPYVVDFGLAVSRQFAQRLTQSGMIAGTLPYMAPEQLDSASVDLDARTDVYGLGATLYELLQGRPPQDAQEPEVLVRQILLRDPPRLDLGRADRDLEAIVTRALEKQPRRRFASARDMADDLERYLDDRPTVSRPVGRVGRLWRLAGRHRGMTAVVAGAAGVLLLALSLLAVRAQRDARLLRSGIAAAEQLIASEELEAAGGKIAELRRTWGTDARVQDLAARHEAVMSTELLLDRLVMRPEYQGIRDLEAAAARVRAAGGAAEAGWRAAAALVVADLYLGRSEAARAGLAAMMASEPVERRATTALMAVLENATEIPLEVPGTSALDHVLTFVALRMSGAPLERLQEELELARAHDAEDYRRKLATAIALAEAHQHASARVAFDMLPAPGRSEEVKALALRRLNLVTGRYDRVLEEIEALPAASRRPMDEVDRLTALSLLGRHDAVSRELERLLAASSAEDELRLFAGQWAWSRGRIAEGRTQLEIVADHGRWPLHREEAQALLLGMELERLAASTREGGEEDPATAEALEQLSERARELGERAASPFARCRALLVASRVTMATKSREEALAPLRQAIEAYPDDPLPRLELARLATGLIRDHARAAGKRALRPNLSSEIVDLLVEARRVIAPLLAEGRPTVLPLDLRMRYEVISDAMRLAWFDQDIHALRELLPRALELGDALDWPDEDFERWAESLVRALDVTPP